MPLLSWQYSRNVSQTRWIIDDERMGEASVEVLSILANGCGPLCFLLMLIVKGDNKCVQLVVGNNWWKHPPSLPR